MASAKQRKATFISNKLKFLKDQGDDLISAVGQYVNKITVAGDSWTQGGDNNMEFQELCQMIESASLFLCEKCQELADLSSQSITAAASTPSTSVRQPTAPLASTATISCSQSTESVQPADGADMKPVLDRIAVIETRLQTLEADGGRHVKDVQNQAEKGETNFRILCQMLNDRLKPLEQLRTCLNELASKRDDNVTKLSQLIEEVAVMSPRVQQLEMKSPGTRCGFNAVTWFTEEVAFYTIIRQYKITDCNVGENFNADSGIFTAPVDGLYVAAISLWLTENECLSVSVEHKHSLDQESGTPVCRSSVGMKQTNACDVAVVDLKAGEVLYSRVNHVKKNNYDKWVHFSCFLLG